MRKAGVPVVPGSYEPVRGLEEAKMIAAEIGYPVMVKPSGGGAGIGMVVVNSEEELGGGYWFFSVDCRFNLCLE